MYMFQWGGAESDVIRGLEFQVPRLPRSGSSDGKETHTTIWTFRGIMLLQMVQVGMQSLPLGGISLDEFASMNPDQKGNLDKLIAGNRSTVYSVQQLLKLCGVHGVLLCWGQMLRLRRCWEQLRRLHGMSPHVAQVRKKLQRS